MRLSTRLAIAMVGLVLFTALAVVVLSYRNLEAEIVPRALEVIEGRTRLLADKFAEHTQRAIDDLPGLRATAALSGILRARASGGVDPVDGVTEETWRQRVADQYAGELAAKPAYYKMPIIGVEDGGREIVRVDRSGTAPINGRQLADAALKLRPSLKVLFTSGYTKDAITHHGRLDPGVLLLTKPHRRSDLARMIRVALETAPAGTQESTADAP